MYWEDFIFWSYLFEFGRKAVVDSSKPKPSLFELYKLYIETVDKMSERLNAANTWMLLVNSALVALYAFLEKGKD